MRIVNRTDAARSGLKRSYTGRVCRRGHDSERYTSNGMCCECMQKPVGLIVRVSFDVHQEDRKELEAYAAALAYQRGEVFTRMEPMSDDEKGYWNMIANLRKQSWPEDHLKVNFRSYKTFTLPDGVDP